MQKQEDDISLRDYIKVVIKRKNLILAACLITMITTAVISLGIPKMYEISMIVEPSVTGMTSDGPLYLDSPENITAKIKEKTFDSEIVKSLNLDPQKANLNFKVYNPKSSNLVKISLNRTKEQTEPGLRLLKALFTELCNSYQDELKYEKIVIESKISDITKRLSIEKQEVALQNKEIEILKKREKELAAERDEVKENIKKLNSQRDILLDAEDKQNGGTSVIFYFNIIQQNIAYLGEINNRIAGMAAERERITTLLESANERISELGDRIRVLSLKKENIRNVKLLQKPTLSVQPIGPKKKQKVIVAGLAGLIAGLFLAFFVEFLSKS